MSNEHEHKRHLRVAVLTTSGRWPAVGFEEVQLSEKVRHVLHQATHHLHLAGTDDWIATVGTQTLNLDHSWHQNGFTGGDVLVDFGPRHGGGGRA
jgi:hypothetical protein